MRFGSDNIKAIGGKYLLATALLETTGILLKRGFLFVSFPKLDRFWPQILEACPSLNMDEQAVHDCHHKKHVQGVLRGQRN
jgi:hypothetical protein